MADTRNYEVGATLATFVCVTDVLPYCRLSKVTLSYFKLGYAELD